MRSSSSLALAAAGLAASALPAAAATRLVPQQYPTIQAGVTAAQPGDTVLVSPKPHGGAYSEAVTVTTPNIRLVGVGSPVLDGTAFNTSVVEYPGSPYSYTYYTGAIGIDIQASHVSVSGFTVQNFGPQEALDQYGLAYGTPPSAGINSGRAVQSSAPSDITVSGCVLRNNLVGVSLNGNAGGGFGSQPTFASGYRVLGCQAVGNASSGVSVTGDHVTVAATLLNKNGGDGLDVFGEGLTVTGNEAGNNAGSGLNVDDYDLYNTPDYPTNPTNAPAGPTTVALNSVHDNGYVGIETDGTMSLTGNAVLRNAEYGLYMLGGADGSTVSGNVIAGTTADPNVGSYGDPGTGLYVEETDDDPSNVTVSFNQISGNAGDGLFLEYASGVLIADNTVTGNGVVGIHLSDYATYDGDMPNTVTRNVALRNAQYDAFDDAAAPDTDPLTDADGDTEYPGDGGYYGPTANVWTKDLFGRTDPPGLGK